MEDISVAVAQLRKIGDAHVANEHNLGRRLRDAWECGGLDDLCYDSQTAALREVGDRYTEAWWQLYQEDSKERRTYDTLQGVFWILVCKETKEKRQQWVRLS